ncbi:phosphomevalonate kinase [Leuconostoc carnosum]|uniref:phosphomevalonate kinase n=1 Tax=Leuconostoc carnosum TaxID=1252 RepID=UPI00345D995F
MTKISVPGKLFLAGEYAITNPGNTAIVAAITTGLSVEITPATKNSTIQSNTIKQPLLFQLDQLNKPWPDDWRYVWAAIKIIYDYNQLSDSIKSMDPIHISINSHLNTSAGKIGLGSSAAVTVGIIAAFDDYFQLNLPILVRFKLAGLAHLHVQKNGSLGDIAAITYGGVISYQSPDLSQYSQPNHNWLDASLANQFWPNLNIQTLTWPQNWQLLLGMTHESADTKAAINHVVLSEQFLTASQQIVNDIIQAIQDVNYTELSITLTDNQQLLTANLPTNYITPKLAHLLSDLDGIAGKISGAGFGDNGFAVTNYDDQKLTVKWQSHHIDSQHITIAPRQRG